jgi:hypothetical protein
VSSKSDSESIGLTELIYKVKQELLDPGSRQADPVPLFAVGEIELEIAVSVSREGKAGINIQVLDLGGGVSKAEAQIVRVTLKPLLTRDELVAELRKQHPQLFASVMNGAMDTLKGGY